MIESSDFETDPGIVRKQVENLFCTVMTQTPTPQRTDHTSIKTTMESVVSLRRALLCLIGLLLIKVCEYLIVEPRLEQLVAQHSLNVKVNTEIDGC